MLFVKLNHYLFSLIVSNYFCSSAVAEGESPFSGSSSQTVLQGGTDASLKATPINTTQRKATGQSTGTRSRLSPLSGQAIDELNSELSNARRRLNGGIDDNRLRSSASSPAIEFRQLGAPTLSTEQRRLLEAEIQRSKYNNQPRFPYRGTAVESIPYPGQAPLTRRPQLDTPIVSPDSRRQLEAELQKAKGFNRTPVYHQSTPNQPYFDQGQALDAINNELRRSKNLQPQTGLMPTIAKPMAVDSSAIETEMRKAQAALRNPIAPFPDIKANVSGSVISRQLEAELAAERGKIKPYNDAVQKAATAEFKRVFSRIAMPEELLASSSALTLNESAVLWDNWFKKFDNLSKPLILELVEEAGNPAGDNTIEITVDKNQAITVGLVRRSSPAFDRATKAAYLALSGNREIRFPAGSNRNRVVFLVDNSKEAEGPVSDINSKTLTGEFENH